MSEPIEPGEEKPGRSWLLTALPLVVFLALAAVFYKQLAGGGATSDLPSALIGRDAPKSNMEPLIGLKENGQQVPAFTSELYADKVSLVNVWASWCAPCRQEHPLLVELRKNDDVQILGLNYKDKTENALRFLGQLGNPYDAVGVDPKGRVAIEWGVYGVPETFVVNSDGVIIHRHVGPLTAEIMTKTILPIIQRAVPASDNSGGAS